MAQYQTKISNTMRRLVSVILGGSDGEPNPTGVQIKDYPEYTNYHVDCVFKGEDSNGDAFEIKPLKVNKFYISQDFNDAFLDNIEVNISIRTVEFLTMFYGYQDLRCDITLRYAHQVSGEVKNLDIGGEPAYKLENYRVIFKDKQDLRKKLPKESLIPESALDQSPQTEILLTDIALQLIEPDEYELRVKRLSFQLTNSTVKDAVLFVAHSCNIDKVAFVEPDNTEEICNIVVPPTQTFDSALLYLQERYGIYNKGLGFYYTKGILYIYPKYETSPVFPTCPDEDTPNLYFIGGLTYPHLNANHAKDIHGTTHIVINSASYNRDLVDAGIENSGTATMITHADRVIDAWRTVKEPKGAVCSRIGLSKMDIHRTPNTSMFALKPCERKKLGIHPKANIIKYTLDEGNIYKHRVPFNEYKRTVIDTFWDNAILDVFKPGYRILWNYDDEDKKGRDQDDDTGQSYMYTTKTGVVEGIHYEFNLTNRVNNRDLHRCMASLQISIEMDVGDDQEGGDTSSDIDEAEANRDIGRGSAYKLAETRGPARECRNIGTVFYLRTTDDSKLSSGELQLKRQLQAEDAQRLVNNSSIY